MSDVELVIKIPEESYEFAKECKAKGSSKHNWNLAHDHIVLMVANGTPLPKEHGVLKDADKIKASMFAYMMDKDKSHEAKSVMSVAKSMVDLEKTIIEADMEEREG